MSAEAILDRLLGVKKAKGPDRYNKVALRNTYRAAVRNNKGQYCKRINCYNGFTWQKMPTPDVRLPVFPFVLGFQRIHYLLLQF